MNEIVETVMAQSTCECVQGSGSNDTVVNIPECELVV